MAVPLRHDTVDERERGLLLKVEANRERLLLRVELRRVKRVVTKACRVGRVKDGLVGRQILARGHQSAELIAAVHRCAGVVRVGLVVPTWVATRDDWRVGAAGEVAVGIIVAIDADLLAPVMSPVHIKNEECEVERGGDVVRDVGIT